MWRILFSIILLLGACTKSKNKEEKPSEGLGNFLSYWVEDRYTQGNFYGFRIDPVQAPIPDVNGNITPEDFFNEVNRQALKVAHLDSTQESVRKIKKLYPDQIPKYQFNATMSSETNYEEFWHAVKPIVGPIFSATLEALRLPRTQLNPWPILHFRCSDTPFLKHGDYTFSKYSFLDQVIEHMEKNHIPKYSNWYLMTACGHNVPVDKKETWCKACECYIDDLRSYLKDKKQIELTVLRSRPILEDWAAMFKAPVLIATTPSSYSFMAGRVSPGHFYLPAFSKQHKETGLVIQKSLNLYPSEVFFVPQTPKDIILHDSTNWEQCSEVVKTLRGI